nr:hypothetical protein BaRGS_010523 [Batillaria attramentaria]
MKSVTEQVKKADRATNSAAVSKVTDRVCVCKSKIQTFLNTCLRRIFNIRWPEKIRNEELWERAGQEPVAKQILRRKRIFNIRWPEKIRNEELWERAGQEPVAKQILRRKQTGELLKGKKKD